MHPQGNMSATWIAVAYTREIISVPLQSNSTISRHETDWYDVTKNISLDPLRDLISISYIFRSSIENVTIVKFLQRFTKDKDVLMEINLEGQMVNLIDISAKKLTLYITKKRAESYQGKA